MTAPGLDRLERVHLHARWPARRARRRSTRRRAPRPPRSARRRGGRRTGRRWRRGAGRSRRGRSCRGRRPARGRRRPARGRWCRAPCTGPRRTPASMRQFSPMTAGPDDGGLGVDLGPLPHVDAVAHLEAGDLDAHPAVEDVLVGPQVGLERADVLPVALGDGAEERLARRRAAPGTPRRRSRPSGRARCSRRSPARARRCRC